MRVEHIGDAALHLGAYLEVLPTIGKVGAIVADPPYGINYRSTHNSSRRGKWAKWVRTENMPGILGMTSRWIRCRCLPSVCRP